VFSAAGGGQSVKASKQRPLKELVHTPIASLAEPWQPVFFEAVCSLLDGGGDKSLDVRLKGIILRTSGSSGLDGLHAYYLLCPHEGCLANYEEEPAPVPLDPDTEKPDGPLFVCNCHFSVFNPRNGHLVSGPARRGLFCFGLRESGDQVEIVSIEEEALR
jgi:Rieske Fe-S protein